MGRHHAYQIPGPPTPRSSQPALPPPLAYFLTWHTYGTWLPGDERGWVQYNHGAQPPDKLRELASSDCMTENACLLDPEQRRVVEHTIKTHCARRQWRLFALTCRTNHVHVVVAASASPDDVMSQLKTWCTRRLKELEKSRSEGRGDLNCSIREHWWVERGSRRWLNDEAGLEGAIDYVLEAQDRKGCDEP